MPNEASYVTVVTAFLVAEKIRGKMTRKCNFGQFEFFDIWYIYAASLLVKE